MGSSGVEEVRASIKKLASDVLSIINVKRLCERDWTYKGGGKQEVRNGMTHNQLTKEDVHEGFKDTNEILIILIY